MKCKNQKYEFTGETKMLLGGIIVHRIRAVMTFGCVSAGEIGGWIETPDNLSVAGNAWVAGERWARRKELNAAELKAAERMWNDWHRKVVL